MEVGKQTFKGNEFTTFLDNPDSDLVALLRLAEKEIMFLDLHIYKENGRLETTILLQTNTQSSVSSWLFLS